MPRKTPRRRTNKKRVRFIKGGNSVVFPPTISNSIAAANPQSYLPYNNFSNDPGYSVIGARNNGNFLTGGKKCLIVDGKPVRSARVYYQISTLMPIARYTPKHSSRKKKRRLIRKNKTNKMRGGGGESSLLLSNLMNTATNHSGILPAPAINESSGVAGIMSGFSGNGSAYNSNPMQIAPLA